MKAMILSIPTVSIKAIFGDKRLNLRFEKILNVLNSCIEHSIPLTFKNRGVIKSVYRFLNNVKVTDQAIIQAQCESIKIESGNVYLAIHDTTEVELTGHRAHAELGCLSKEHIKGFYLHNTLLCDDKGIPECVFAQHFWSRTPESLSKKLQRKHLPTEQKESYRWVESVDKVIRFFENHSDSTAINICDREGDIYELLAKHTSKNVHYIIRSCNNRRMAEDTKIWDEVKLQPIQFTYQIEIFDRQLAKKRVAQLEVKWLKDAQLEPPYRRTDKLKPIKVGVIYIQEINAPKQVPPINWKLITSLTLTTKEELQTAIIYYSFRWRIESFHYILKQGCNIEDLQLEQAQSLKNAISVFSFISCRLLAMMYLSREYPDTSLQKIAITKQQFKLLCLYLEKQFNFKFDQQTKVPNVGNFTLLIGRLGGYLKNKPHNPGIKILWRGMREFITIQSTIQLADDIKCG